MVGCASVLWHGWMRVGPLDMREFDSMNADTLHEASSTTTKIQLQ